MLRISSPGIYSRTSLNAIPRPLKAEWYSPENTCADNPRVLISIFRTRFNSSDDSIREGLWYFYNI